MKHESGGGVIFDLDGTLCYTLEDIAAAANHALRTVDLEPLPVETYRFLVGRGVNVLMERATGDARSERVAELVEAFEAYYRRHAVDHSKPYPGIPELLDALTARSIPIAVLSNKPHEFTVMTIERLLGRWTFTAVEGYRDEATKKPSPIVSLQIAKQMAAAPGDVWFVGDSQVDMHTAHGAGMIAVGAKWGYGTIEELREAGAELLINRPGDLLDLMRARSVR